LRSEFDLLLLGAGNGQSRAISQVPVAAGFLIGRYGL